MKKLYQRVIEIEISEDGSFPDISPDAEVILYVDWIDNEDHIRQAVDLMLKANPSIIQIAGKCAGLWGKTVMDMIKSKASGMGTEPLLSIWKTPVDPDKLIGGSESGSVYFLYDWSIDRRADTIYNRVICTGAFFQKWLLDDTAEDEETSSISFQKLLSRNDELEAYNDVPRNYSINSLENGFVELKFTTRWFYPIQAICSALETEHDLTWYAAGDNYDYVSKFVWNNKAVEEYVLFLKRSAFEIWVKERMDWIKKQRYEPFESLVWLYRPEEVQKWKGPVPGDLFVRYQYRFDANIWRYITDMEEWRKYDPYDPEGNKYDEVSFARFTCPCGIKERNDFYPNPFFYYAIDGSELKMLEDSNTTLTIPQIKNTGYYRFYQCLNCNRLYVFRRGNPIPVLMYGEPKKVPDIEAQRNKGSQTDKKERKHHLRKKS